MNNWIRVRYAMTYAWSFCVLIQHERDETEFIRVFNVAHGVFMVAWNESKWTIRHNFFLIIYFLRGSNISNLTSIYSLTRIPDIDYVMQTRSPTYLAPSLEHVLISIRIPLKMQIKYIQNEHKYWYSQFKCLFSLSNKKKSKKVNYPRCVRFD